MTARLTIKGLVLLLLVACGQRGSAQTFVHPGGLHTQADLDRMKTQVAAGAHPWIDDWNVLITDPQAQTGYGTHVQANMGSSRQNADLDAHAAYLNAMRWYISGDVSYANKAVSILNAWSAAVNQVPTGTDTPGLIGIPIMDFALAGEVLRGYSGWAASDFARFQGMMTTYLYPVCHDFLTNHNGACISSFWANWDACNIGSLIAMGVLCDNSAIFNEGATSFQSGAGNGSIINAVYYLHTPTLGQWQESGRDQEHAQLGIGLLGSACQVAWNQGVDLFGYSNNRLLAGAEYVAQTNLSQSVPFIYYANCAASNNDWVSINGLGRLDDRPVWELIYNHYAVLQGLSAPNSKAMAQLMRPEHGSQDHFGYGSLTFTLSETVSPYPPLPTPAAPAGLTATPGVSQVALKWDPSPVNAAQGYNVLRATTSGGPYTTIASWTASTCPQYVDATVTNGATYYYVVAANNQSGTSLTSAPASATPLAAGPLPSGWTNQDVGTATPGGSANYANVSNGTVIANGSGSGLGGAADAGYNYTYIAVTGDFILTARIWSVNWNSGGGEVGLMMRESLNANSSEIQMTLGGVGVREGKAATRVSTGANLNHYGGNDYTSLPAWFRLQRSGNNFTAYESSDGIAWFAVRSDTIAMPNTYYAGLVLANGSTTTLNTATFDHVNFSSPGAPSGLLAAEASSSEVTLSWSASGAATSYNVKRAVISGGPYTTIATNLAPASYLDPGLSIGTTYYYVVSASNVIGESPNSSEASVTLVSSTTVSLVPVAALDGYVRASSSANTEGGTAYPTTNPSRLGDDSSNRQYKAILSFDTSSIPDDATIASATLMFKRAALTGTNPFLTHGTCYADVKAGVGFNGSTTLETADFQATADATQVATMSNPVSDRDWSSGALNAIGLKSVGKTTATQFRVYFAMPSNNDGGNDYISWDTGEDGSVANRPVLQVTYFEDSPVMGPKAYLRFDESSGPTAIDSSGNRWDGTLVNGPTWVAGKTNNAVSLIGASQYVTLPASIVNALSDFTISAWVNLTTISNWQRIFDFGTGTNSYMFLTPMNAANGKIRFAITNTGSGSEQQIDAAAALPAGTWTHMAVTHSGSIGTLYVNGTAVGTNTAMTLQPSTLGNTNLNYIGKSQFSGDPYLNGLVDEFRIYNRALSAAEISGLIAPPTITGASTATGTSGNAFSYQIAASNNPTSYGASNLPNGLDVNTSSGLISGTPTVTGTFNPTVSASNASGTGSATLTITVLPPAPTAPTGLAATGSSAAVALSWSASGGATSYTLSRSVNSGSGYVALAGGTTAATTYNDAGLPDGMTYYYVVTAANPGGTSGNSNEAAATTYTAIENWRLANFGTTANSGNAADTADPDADGWSNFQEYSGGTDPNDETSSLLISGIHMSTDNANDVIVSFPTVLGKSYRLEYSDSLAAWSPVLTSGVPADSVAGTGSLVQVTDTNGAEQTMRFYRIVLRSLD